MEGRDRSDLMSKRDGRGKSWKDRSDNFVSVLLQLSIILAHS